MASIGSLTSTTSSSIYSSTTSTSKGITGLASGLDVDELVEGMTYSTRAKIAAKLQNKQILSWKMDAYRSVSSKLVEFAQKYTSYTSSTNLYSASFYKENNVTAKGDNSKYVSVSGSSSGAESLSILGVKQLATSASFNTSAVSDRVLETGVFDLGGTVSESNVAGKYITVSYGSETYTVFLDSSNTYDTLEDVANTLNATFHNNEALGDFSDKINVTLSESENALVFSFADSSDSNTFEIKSGSSGFLGLLGIKEGDKLSSYDGQTSFTGEVVEDTSLTKITNVTDMMAGKAMTFNYNGTSKSILLPTADELSAMDGDDLAAYIQSKLETAFGTGRFEVTFNEEGSDLEGSLSIATTLPSGGADTTSVLKITTAATGLLGDSGVFKMQSGESNVVNLNASIGASGLASAAGLTGGETKTDDDGNVYEEYTITVNGKSFTFKDTDTISDIIKEINNDEDANVTIAYSEISDTFTVKSDETGVGGGAAITDATGNLAETLFGTGYTVKAGQDAIMTVDFDGEGGAGPVDITRSDNTFNLDGLKISVSGLFGEYDGSGNIVTTVGSADAVTFNAEANIDNIVDAVKTMVEEYNAIIKLVNSELGTKRDRDYAPLTDEQKEDMTEDEIKTWEEKAKAGMLFNDSTLRSLAGELRNVFSSLSKTQLSAVGLSTSTDYSENGKLSLDESALRAALKEDASAVGEFFSAAKTSTSKGGVMTQLKAATDKYAATTGYTKGSLIEMAGSESAPTSITSNSLQKQMDDIDDQVDRLKDLLASEKERYYNKFTQLEQLVSQMNSQSSWLTSMLGY